MNSGYYSVTRIITKFRIKEDKRGKFTFYIKGEKVFPVYKILPEFILNKFRIK